MTDDAPADLALCGEQGELTAFGRIPIELGADGRPLPVEFPEAAEATLVRGCLLRTWLTSTPIYIEFDNETYVAPGALLTVNLPMLIHP